MTSRAVFNQRTRFTSWLSVARPAVGATPAPPSVTLPALATSGDETEAGFEGILLS